MVAAEASAYLSDNIISYLWTCDTLRLTVL